MYGLKSHESNCTYFLSKILFKNLSFSKFSFIVFLVSFNHWHWYTTWFQDSSFLSFLFLNILEFSVIRFSFPFTLCEFPLSLKCSDLLSQQFLSIFSFILSSFHVSDLSPPRVVFLQTTLGCYSLIPLVSRSIVFVCISFYLEFHKHVQVILWWTK